MCGNLAYNYAVFMVASNPETDGILNTFISDRDFLWKLKESNPRYSIVKTVGSNSGEAESFTLFQSVNNRKLADLDKGDYGQLQATTGQGDGTESAPSVINKMSFGIGAINPATTVDLQHIEVLCKMEYVVLFSGNDPVDIGANV
jgi:hypothetical protein